MTKEELVAIALSKKIITKSYIDAVGSNEAEKFLYAHNLVPKEGKHVSCQVVYLRYYLWAKDPLKHKAFRIQMAKFVKSFAFRQKSNRVTLRTYKLKNFAPYDIFEEVAARKLINEQKEKARRQKERKQKQKEIRKLQKATCKETGRSEG